MSKPIYYSATIGIDNLDCNLAKSRLEKALTAKQLLDERYCDENCQKVNKCDEIMHVLYRINANSK